jgi:hypothetical protein
MLVAWGGLVLHTTPGRDKTKKKKWKEEMNEGLYPLLQVPEYTEHMI